MTRILQALLQRSLAPALRELRVALERIAQEIQKLQQQHARVLEELQALRGEREAVKRAAEAEPDPEVDPGASAAWRQLEGRMAVLEEELIRLRGAVDGLTAAVRAFPRPEPSAAPEGTLETDSRPEEEIREATEVPSPPYPHKLPSKRERSEPEGDTSAEELPEAPLPAESARQVERTRAEELPQLRVPSITPRTRTRRPPEQRGGRPRVGREARVRADVPEILTRTSPSRAVRAAKGLGQKPELLCVRRGREWELLLKPPEGADALELEVRQGDGSLPWDDALGAWLLPRLDEAVTVEGPSGRRRVFERLSTDEGLLFKLNADLDKGRRVQKASQGWYLAIVPEGWKRAGDSPPAPEPVAIPGYAAHYVDLSEDPRVAFLVGGQERVPWQRIELHPVGERLPDAAEGLGPLFRGPPAVRADRSVWETIATVVVGEEGPGEGRWKTSFQPDPTQEVQGLPPELAARGGGWYFLRFYDHADELIDSMDFRFLSGLEGIRVEPGDPVIVPGPEGHRPARVEFRHQEGYRVELCDRASAPLRVVREGRRTVVILPPEPGWDETRWRVQARSQGASSRPATVDLKIRLPRLWWALAEEDGPPEEVEWQARPLLFTREEFRATSKKALWLKLPPGVRQIRFGFPGDLRSFRAKAGSSSVAVPLWEFTEAETLDRPGETPLRVRLPLSEPEVEVEAEAGRLEVRLRCRLCAFGTRDKGEFLEHLFREHRPQLYREPTWSELRQWIPHLPRYVLACPYCDEYVAEADDLYPTSTITRHVEETHKTRTKYGSGPSYRIVQDVEEIRRKLTKYRDLPRFQICQLCKELFDLRNVQGEELLQHIMKRHWGEVSQLM